MKLGRTTPILRIFDLVKAREFYEELSEREYRYLKPHIEETEWGSRIMSVTDPFGNRLTFSQAKQ